MARTGIASCAIHHRQRCYGLGPSKCHVGEGPADRSQRGHHQTSGLMVAIASDKAAALSSWLIGLKNSVFTGESPGARWQARQLVHMRLC